MPKARSPNRDKAFEIYKANNGNIDLIKIAEQLGIGAGTVRGWKAKDKWEELLEGTTPKKERNAPKKESKKERNAPKKRTGRKPGDGNKEIFKLGVATQFKKGNQAALKHGLFSKYLPQETQELMECVEQINPLDMIWENIKIQFAAIIRAQQIMHVTDKDEIIKVKTKEVRGEKSDADEWEFQFAWDRQASFLSAQSRAMAELRSAIKQYDEMLHKNWDLATEEQKARIALLKAKIESEDEEETEDDGFMDALKGQVDSVWQE